MQYDAALDDRFTAWGVQLAYAISPTVRLGASGTTAQIGDVPRDWVLPSSSERVYRVSAFAEIVAIDPLRQGRVPVLDRLDFTLRGQVGVFHSSGVTVDPDLPFGQPFFGITDTPTGLALGLGVGVEYGPMGPVRIISQLNVWRDQAYGGSLTNPDVMFGISISP
jgi:hypothetical protein